MGVGSRQVNLSWVIVGKDGFDGSNGGDMVGDKVGLCLCERWWALQRADPSVDPRATL